MEITLTRNSIIGTGEIKQLDDTLLADGTIDEAKPSRSGLVEQLKWAKKGETVSVKNEIASRLIALGSAFKGKPKKATA